MTVAGYSFSIEGLAALANSLMLVPSVLALRKIAKGHDDRLTVLEVRVKGPVKRKRAPRAR